MARLHHVFGADAGERHTLVTQTAQEQRARRIEAIERGQYPTRGRSWPRPLLQGKSSR